MHLNNPNASLLGTVTTVVAGVLRHRLVKTRSLWMPYGIHLGWNLGLGFVSGFRQASTSLLTTGTAGSDTILEATTAEGGLLVTFILPLRQFS
jgi:membrane protease YdiL (CAAX protease family)